MVCKRCNFYHSGYMCNSCDLTETENFLEYIDKPCPFINDNYMFTQDCLPLGYVKGESAIKFVKGGAKNA